MVVGDKVKIRGSDVLEVFTITRIGIGSARLENVVTHRSDEYPLDSLVATTLNPQKFITTYSKEWASNVFAILKKEKIKHLRVKKQDTISEIYVDSRKMLKAKRAYEEYYKRLTP